MKKICMLLVFLLLVGPLTASADNEIKALYEATKNDFETVKGRFSKLNDQRAAEWKEFQKKTYSAIEERNRKIEAMSKKGASETAKGAKNANKAALEQLGRMQTSLREQTKSCDAYLKDHTKKSFEYAKEAEKKTEEDIKKFVHSDKQQ